MGKDGGGSLPLICIYWVFKLGGGKGGRSTILGGLNCL